MTISNATMAKHKFLLAMVKDAYFPRDLIARGEKILVHLCECIESETTSR